MKNTDKVTLTVGQLKRLIKESTINNKGRRIIEYYSDDYEDHDVTEQEIMKIVRKDLRDFGYSGIKVRVLKTTGGPQGGWPVVELSGNLDKIDDYVMEIMDLSKDDLDEYYNEFNYYKKY